MDRNDQILTAKDYLTYNILINRRILFFIGAWPSSLCESRLEKMFIKITAIINIILVSFILFSALLAIILNKDDNIHDRIQISGPLLFFIVAASNGYFFLTRGDQIKQFIEHMRTDRDSIDDNLVSDGKILLIEKAKVGKSLSMIGFWFLFITVSFYTVVMPFIAPQTETIGNVTVRATTYPIYRGLLDPRDSPYFEIVQVLHCLGGTMMCANHLTLCIVTSVCVTHACGQLKIMMFRLESCVNEFSVESKGMVNDLQVHFTSFVKHHSRVINFISGVEKLLSEIYFMEIAAYTLDICLATFYCILHWRNGDILKFVIDILLIAVFCFHIFVPCYVGDLLIQEFINVGDACYMTDWYHLPNKRALYFIVIMSASRHSPKLTAGNFADLSLRTFSSVMKSSMAYLNFILNIPE